jgi:hypothetical protein
LSECWYFYGPFSAESFKMGLKVDEETEGKSGISGRGSSNEIFWAFGASIAMTQKINIIY